MGGRKVVVVISEGKTKTSVKLPDWVAEKICRQKNEKSVVVASVSGVVHILFS